MTDPQDILNEIHSFYSELYKKPSNSNNTTGNATTTNNRPTSLTDENSKKCEGLITISEVNKALKSMKNSKSPGCDGLPAEFYKKFFHILGNSLVEFLNYCFTKGELSPSCKLATITLLCKDKEKCSDLKNWRPISLLNTDVKILSKILCNRLKQVITTIVNKDQTCGIPGRSILDNLHLLRNTLDYVKQKDLKLILLSLDFRKAFDNVSHDFLFKTLSNFGFGPDFIKWVKLLYTDVKSQVLANGFITKPFSIQRGVRQGCGLSPLLFVLVVEVLGNMIRNNPKIKGLKLPGSAEELKISQYADDINLFLSEPRSVYETLKTFSTFSAASGLSLNMEKSWGWWLGGYKNRTDTPFGLNWTTDSNKIYGITFGNNQNVNWVRVRNKMALSANLMSQRHLTFSDKSQLIQQSLASKVWYIGNAIYLPLKFGKSLDRIICKFLWGKKMEVVSRDTIKLPRDKGGLNIVDIETKIAAMRVKHILTAIDTDAKWKFFTIYWIGLTLNTYYPNITDNRSPHSETIPIFYQQALRLFHRFKQLSADKVKPTTKNIYLLLKSSPIHKPKIEAKLPHLNFSSIWTNICIPSIDPTHHDVTWKIIHNVITTADFLHKLNITKNSTCVWCENIESITHLFVLCQHSRALWEYVEAIVSHCNKQPFKLKASEILYLNFKPDLSKTHKNLISYLVCLGKHCIWVFRNLQKFEGRVISAHHLKTYFYNVFKQRILAEHKRLSPDHFQKSWCYNTVSVSEENSLQVKFKPP